LTEEKSKSTILLVILVALLIFAGPTYAVYVLTHVLDLNYFVSIGSGFALFIVGVVFLLFLMRRKIIV
jgi:hypothetical protein